MKLDAVSNTHDNLDRVETTVLHLESEGIDVVVHYGDIITPFLTTPFDAGFDFHVVRGDNDGEWALRETIESFDTYRSGFAYPMLDDQEIAVYHGTEAGLVGTLVDSGACDSVLRGHNHGRVVEHHGATAHINPGGLPISGTDGASHAAVIDLDTGNMVSRSL